MFSASNFLFLISIAIASWVLLCYFKQVRDEHEEDYNMEVDLEHSLLGDPEVLSCSTDYDIYIIFVTICACVFALAKIMSITEKYILARISEEEGLTASISGFNGSLQDSTHELLELNDVEEYKQLLQQFENVKKNTTELERRVRELEETNILLQSDPFNCCDHIDPEKYFKSNPQNIFISNQHFHLNTEDLANESFSCTWQKYLEMRKCCNQSMPESKELKDVESSCSLNVQSEEGKTLVPKIVSTEDLQRMQGIY